MHRIRVPFRGVLRFVSVGLQEGHERLPAVGLDDGVQVLRRAPRAVEGEGQAAHDRMAVAALFEETRDQIVGSKKVDGPASRMSGAADGTGPPA